MQALLSVMDVTQPLATPMFSIGAFAAQPKVAMAAASETTGKDQWGFVVTWCAIRLAAAAAAIGRVLNEVISNLLLKT